MASHKATLLRVGSHDEENVEHADWVEISTLYRKDGSVSRHDLASAIKREHGGKDARALSVADDAFDELSDRLAAFKNAGRTAAYPFEFSSKKDVLRRKKQSAAARKQSLLYLFMLAVSRLPMDDKTKHKDIDPRKVFESLCCDVLKLFWGGDGIVFGTATEKKQKFRERVQALCDSLCEGLGPHPDARAPGGGDGKLDLAVWRRSLDKRTGGLVGFAQCKTGVHWRDHLARLQPRSFCQNYFQQNLVLEPVRIYMVPHRISSTRWRDDHINGGLLFDRCRIGEFGEKVGGSTVKDCRTWLVKTLGKTPHAV